MISEIIPSVNDFLLLAVAEAQPTERFLRAISIRRIGDESTALGWLTAPIFILVIPPSSYSLFPIPR